MEHLLSIKTVFPRRGARVWYDDQREVHRQIYAGDDVVDYAFMGTYPNSADNRWLLDAMREQNPGHLFPRHLARSVSAHHPHFYHRVAPGGSPGPTCFRGDRRGVGSSCLAGGPRASLRASRGQDTPTSSILSRCRPERLRRSVCDFSVAGTPAPRCRSHRYGTFSRKAAAGTLCHEHAHRPSRNGR
jgi:hypothetical protein